MASTDNTLWPRLRLVGRLECTAPLHIGDGGADAFADREYRNDQDDQHEGRFNSVCRDAQGRPYIPASTLRGYLKSQLEPAAPGLAVAPDLAVLGRQLFGELADDHGVAGRLRVFDARWCGDPTDTTLPLWDGRRHTQIQHGVKLDDRTGTVDGRTLHRHEAVPVGTRFECALEADDLTRAHLGLLLGLLATLDGRAGSALGRGVSRQAGRLRWDLDRIEVLTQDRLLDWLDQPGAGLNGAFASLKPHPDPTPLPHRTRPPAVGFRLLPQGPLLVHEPGLCRRKPDSRPAEQDPADPRDERHDPDLEFSRTPDRRALVPAASLRGLVRARARRIVATIAAARMGADRRDRQPAVSAAVEKAVDRLADAAADRLFGRTGERGRVWLTDAVGERPAGEILQTFVAIDRFTGGGAPGKLYKARAADSGALTGTCLFDARRGAPAPWECGLLLLVARDALEGDLAVGWGKARGYGACEVVLDYAGTQVRDLDTLLRAIPPRYAPEGGLAAARDWIAALHQWVEDELPADYRSTPSDGAAPAAAEVTRA